MIVGLLLTAAASLSVVAADLNVPTTAYPTIQAAVAAASNGDTIHIAPGVYTGQVEIVSKTLTLIGQPGTILRATTNMTSFGGSVNPPIMEIRSSDVTVRGLTFEGERLAGRFAGLGDLLGIYIRSSSGNVENCAFYGFRESAPGPENAFAIMAAAIHDGEVNVRVAGCTFGDNYGAVFCWGLPDRKYINVTIENNTIIGPGPLTNDNNCTGVNIGEGVSGRIVGNTISGFSYVGTTAAFPISFGILGVNTANFPPDFGALLPLIIEGNILRDNQWHIALVKADNTVVRNNHCHGAAPGILPLGLAASGTNLTIDNNHFEDMPEGIRLLGDDPDFGTLLGTAVNAQVTSNGFCNVTKRINVEPLASDTETGTLICPIPALAIANAVLLSWPNYADGWIVESAPGPLGPWTSLNVSPSFQDGQYVFAVKTAGQQALFRLRQP